MGPDLGKEQRLAKARGLKSKLMTNLTCGDIVKELVDNVSATKVVYKVLEIIMTNGAWSIKINNIWDRI